MNIMKLNNIIEIKKIIYNLFSKIERKKRRRRKRRKKVNEKL